MQVWPISLVHWLLWRESQAACQAQSRNLVFWANCTSLGEIHSLTDEICIVICLPFLLRRTEFPFLSTIVPLSEITVSGSPCAVNISVMCFIILDAAVFLPREPLCSVVTLFWQCPDSLHELAAGSFFLQLVEQWYEFLLGSCAQSRIAPLSLAGILGHMMSKVASAADISSNSHGAYARGTACLATK